MITGLSTGGAERALYNLLQGGLAVKFNTYVISLSDKGTIGSQIEALGVPVITLDMPVGRPTLAGVIKLRRVIKEFQPDLIQGWMYHGNLASTIARFSSSKRTVLAWNVRQSLYQIENEKRLTQLVIKVNRFLSRTPDAILYNSQLSRKQHEKLGFSEKKGQVIPNGFNLDTFNFSSTNRQRMRAELAIPTVDLVVGHVARLHPMKDHALFLNSSVDIAKRYANTHFLLIGRGVCLDDDHLKELIPESLQSRFHLLGERSDVATLMSAMDIFCQSSNSEAFPNVLGEAMAMGLPCVATNVGDSALIVGDCGVVVKPQDKKELIKGIETLLNLPLNERLLLGERSRKRIKENFALGEIVDEYTTLYNTLVLEKSNA